MKIFALPQHRIPRSAEEDQRTILLIESSPRASEMEEPQLLQSSLLTEGLPSQLKYEKKMKIIIDNQYFILSHLPRPPSILASSDNLS